MSKQTAVEWLIDQFEKHENGQIDWMSRSATKSQALQMEKEQIRDAWTDGCIGELYELNAYFSSGKYYNETYNKES